jgi:hypothetical protein
MTISKLTTYVATGFQHNLAITKTNAYLTVKIAPPQLGVTKFNMYTVVRAASTKLAVTKALVYMVVQQSSYAQQPVVTVIIS